MGISIYEFPHMAASVGASGDDGTLMWRTTESRSVFARAVMEAAQSVLQRIGKESHQATLRWHPFPAATLQDLRRLHLRDDKCSRQHDLSLP